MELTKETPLNVFIQMINIQKQKEEMNDIWKDSPFKEMKLIYLILYKHKL